MNKLESLSSKFLTVVVEKADGACITRRITSMSFFISNFMKICQLEFGGHSGYMASTAALGGWSRLDVGPYWCGIGGFRLNATHL